MNVVNVLAWLPGRDTSRVVVIGGHYDSCVCTTDRFDFTSDAPGADDDGSGTSAIVELARAFSKRYPKGLDATIVFALYAGEEQGLLGSTHFAQRLHDSKYKVAAAVTNDIIGNVVADDGQVDSSSVRIFGADPDNGPSRELARYAWAAGTLYNPAFAVIPVFRLDRISRGGDHSPFVTLRDPGLRFTERLENYKRQHLPTDKLADVNFNYVANVARLNAATLGSIASAPPPPDSVTVRRDQPSGGHGGERQHLVALVDHGLVATDDVQRGTPGRPRHTYHATERAEALFPKAYGALTNELLGLRRRGLVRGNGSQDDVGYT